MRSELISEVGSLEPGKRADIVVFDARRPHIGVWNRPLSTFVSAGRGADAKIVMVDGRICYRDGRFCYGPDATEILREAEDAASVILKLAGLTSRLSPPWRSRVPMGKTDGTWCNDPRQQKHVVAEASSLLISVAKLRADIENRFAELLNQDYPRFSNAEFERRRKFAHKLCERDDLDAVIIAQSMRAGTATFWFTGWPVTQEAVTVIMRGLAPRMYVQYFNHVPLARKLGVNIDVYWGEDSGLRRALEFVRAHSPKPPRLGVVGLLSPNQHQQLAATAATIVDANAAYNEMRLVKSAEEIHWLRLGAGIDRLGNRLPRGSGAAGVERAGARGHRGKIILFALGGTNAIHYFAATPMANPTVAVPAQFPSTRKAPARRRPGDGD